MAHSNNKITALALGIVIIIMGACNDTAFDELPKPIQQFVTQYFPFGEVSSYTTSSNEIHTVNIKNGATIVFNSEYMWIQVNGNGTVLPTDFIYDQLPSTLYRYLQEMQRTDVVYAVSRDASKIVIDLHDTSVQYDIASDTISYPSAS